MIPLNVGVCLACRKPIYKPITLKEYQRVYNDKAQVRQIRFHADCLDDIVHEFSL